MKMKNTNSVYKILSQWQSLINNGNEVHDGDFWIENEFGEFKNPKILEGTNDPLNINFTIVCDEWKKPDDEK